MLFTIGTKVRLVHTGDIGVVEAMLDHGFVKVRLSPEEWIPVGEEALEVITDARPTSVKAKVVPGKQKPQPRPLPFPTGETQYTILKPQGLQLAFDPQQEDGHTSEYHLQLINDTKYHFLYQLDINVDGQSTWNTQGKLGPRALVEAGAVQPFELNHNAIVHLQAWRLLPQGQGTGRKLDKELKIKPAQFVKKLTTAPYLHKAVHLYTLFEMTEIEGSANLPKNTAPPQGQTDLKQLTKQQTQKQKGGQWGNLQSLGNEVWELATFPSEIDLHIDKLVEDYKKIPADKILGVQLQHCEDYLRKAARLGVDRVFLIHGLGEGKLKDAIERQLKDNPDVVDYRNEYHPKYGHGATEVIF